MKNDKDKHWISCKDIYLFNEKALSLVFRGKFIDRMSKACQDNKLKFNDGYRQLKDKLYAKKWVVSVGDPIKKPENVLEYLAHATPIELPLRTAAL